MFNIRNFFQKHPLYTLKEIKTVKPYYIGKIKLKDFVDNALCFFSPKDNLQFVFKKRKDVNEALLEHFNRKDFLILTFSGANIVIYDEELIVNVYIEHKQELQLGHKFKLFKEDMIRDNGVSGLIIVFKNKHDQALANLTKLFGQWK